MTGGEGEKKKQAATTAAADGVGGGESGVSGAMGRVMVSGTTAAAHGSVRRAVGEWDHYSVGAVAPPPPKLR